MLEYFINALSFGLTALLIVFIGNLFFRKVKGGIHIPILGPRYVSKIVGFFAFLLSIFVVGLIFPKIQVWLEEIITQNPILVLPALVGIYLSFNRLFYSR